MSAAATVTAHPPQPSKREPDGGAGSQSSSDDDVPLAKKFNVKRKASPSSSQSATTAAAAAATTVAAASNGDQPSSKKVKTEQPPDSVNGSVDASAAADKREMKKKKKKEKEKRKERERQRVLKEKEAAAAAAAAAAAKKKKPGTAAAAAAVKKEQPRKQAGGNSSSKGEEAEVWRWWEEDKPKDGSKWKFLEHKGPVFAPPYERLPKSVKFYYDGEPMQLSSEAEEVAGFYARMLDHDYASKEAFNNNFFQDWRSVMTHEEQKKIKTLKKCDFKELHRYFAQQAEERKNRSKEEKQKLKEENERLLKEYGFCVLDGHKQKIANFRIEPPGLFRGRGNHPKMGKLKRRVVPEDVIINCSKDSKVPRPPEGRKWKEVRHDNTVSWLACWVENVQGNFKYVMLNAASRLKGEKDWKKYETARHLHKVVDRIRAQYRADFKSKEMRLRQRAVALYFIDKLALRAGNEKDDDEADTVGCCSLRYEHITLHKQHPHLGPYVVEFDFLGKDSIRYNNAVPVERRVFKNLRIFMENKKEGDDLFDRLNTTILNAHLKELMEGLTAKVFRTYNASKTLEDQLEKLTNKEEPMAAKILSYNRANREVAILCNHQRAVPKTFEKSMENLNKKLEEKERAVKAAKREAKAAKVVAKRQKSVKNKQAYEKKKAALRRLEDQLLKLKVQKTDKDENKEIALGTSKLNYLDPRITVAWCRKFHVPVEKVYNKTQREKFQWAIDMATGAYRFQDMESDRGTNRIRENEDDEDDEEEQEDES